MDWVQSSKEAITSKLSGKKQESSSPTVVLPTSNPQSSSGPKILSVAPSGTVDDKGETTRITVTFDRPMVALEALPKEENPGPLTLDPPVKGKYRWFGTSTLIFTPETTLPPATRFTAIVPKGTTAKDGSQLSNDYSWTFDTIHPQFLNSNPYHGSEFVDLDPQFLLGFNQPMSPSRAEASIILKGHPTTNLFGSIKPYQDSDYPEEFPVSVRRATKEEYEKNRWFSRNETACLVATPSRALKREYTYSLILKSGLLAESGNLGLEADRVLQFKSYNNFRVIGVKSPIHPTEGLQITFSNPVTPSELTKAMTFEPSIKTPDEYKDYNYAHYIQNISLPLTARKTYQVALNRALKDKFDQKLGQDFKGSFEVTSFVPRISLPTGNITVESKLKHVVPVDMINIKSAQKLLSPVSPVEAIQTLVETRYGRESWMNPNNRPIDNWSFKNPLNKSVRVPLDLSPALHKDGFGFLFAQLQANEPDPAVEPYPLSFLPHPPRLQSAFVQVTNLGITAKCSPETNLIWVTSLYNTKPVAGAQVELRNDSGSLLWKGETDNQGFSISPGWAFLKINQEGKKRYRYGNPRVWITASYRGDTAMVASNWGMGIYPYQFGISYEDQQIYPEFSGHIYTDRGLYQVGETVHVKGLFRQKRRGDWIVSTKKKVLLLLKNSRGEEVSHETLTVSEYGSFTFDFTISPQSVTGYYSMEVHDPSYKTSAASAGPEGEEGEEGESEGETDQSSSQETENKLYFSGHFQVEAFRPATFEVTTTLAKESYFYGDKAEGTIRGWYLFGAPMKDTKVEWTGRLWETSYQPPGHADYAFGPQRYLTDYKADHQESVLAASAEGKLNNDGEFKVQIPLQAPALLGCLSLQLEAKVTGEDRQSISGRKTAIVHNGDYYVGLKPSTSFIECKKPWQLTIITTQPNGKLVVDKKVSIKIIRREWNSVRKSGIKGRTAWVVEKNDVEVHRTEVKTALSTATFSFTPDKPGYYIIHAESMDGHRRTIYADSYFYCTGTGYVPWERSDDDRIDLIANQSTYKTGETAKIMVKSPFEEAIALVSLEREGILHQFTTTLKGSADVISLPIEEKFVPNVFVSVILLQGRTTQGKYSDQGEDIGKPAFKIGYANLVVDPGTRHLKVIVKQDKKEYRPRGKVTLQIEVKDHEGKPRESECSVAVADKGILNLIGYDTPNSFNSFYGPRALSVETVESRLHVIGQRNYGEKGENRGGGGGVAPGLLSDANLRDRFKGTAFWKAVVLTGKNGKATVSFQLPDDLTTFKIMVTADTKDSRFGGGDSEFQVKKPIMLKPSLPRFARLGDKFHAGVVVHNFTGHNGSLAIEANSSLLKMTENGHKSVLANNGEGKEITFDYSADTLGQATLRFGAELGKETDGLKVTLPIIMPRPTEAVALYENTTGKAEQPVKIPDDIYAEVGGIQLEAASTALLGLKTGIKYLEEYPYECLEQKISRVLPFLLAGDLLESFGISDLKGERKKQIVETVLKDIPRFQHPSGGFTYWPGDIFPCEYITAYTVFFLHQAKKNGYVIDEPVLNKGLAYLQNVLRRPDEATWNYPYNRNAQLETKAFIVYALSLCGRSEPAYINRLYDNLQQIPLFGRAHLLKAIHLNKMNTAMEDAIATSLFNSIKQDPTRAHFEEQDPAGLDWIFDSPVRTTSFILQALVEVNREFPQSAKAIRWLMDERKNGRWRSTQENIYVFYGLTEYFRRYEKEVPNFTATIKLGGKEALRALFSGRSVTSEVRMVPWANLPKGQEIKAEAQKQGTGRLYYGIRMIYAPKGPLSAREEGLKVERLVTMEDGKPVPKVIPAGSRLLVKLNVTTPFDRTYIAVEDPLPAGFQVINTEFKTANSGDASALAKSQQRSKRWTEDEEGDYSVVYESYDWWGGFTHREIYDDRITFFANYLDHGLHSVSYLVTAITPGTFSQPAAKAEGMYTPEVFGRTDEAHIEIK